MSGEAGEGGPLEAGQEGGAVLPRPPSLLAAQPRHLRVRLLAETRTFLETSFLNKSPVNEDSGGLECF
jgi:hypothetical protein